MANQTVLPGTTTQIGIIVGVNDSDPEFLSYNVEIQNYHNEKQFSIGIPIFSFGYNTYTYLPKTQVVCLVKDSDYNKVIIIGQIYDRNIRRKVVAPQPGELQLSTSGNQKSGISSLGSSDKFLLYAGRSNLKFDSSGFEFKVNENVFLNFESSGFNLKLNREGTGISIRDGRFTINSPNGFYNNSYLGPIYLKANNFSFSEGNAKEPNFLISKGLHRQIGLESLNNFGSYKFEGGSKIKGVSNTVEWDILSGNFFIGLGSGDFKVQPSSTSGEISFKIGPLINLSSLVLNRNKFNVLIGTIINGDSLTIGEGSFNISAGSTPTTHSTLQVTDANINMVANAGVTSTEIDLSALQIKLIAPSAGKIILDADVEITGKLLVSKAVFSEDEVYAKVTVVGGQPSTSTAVGLSTHTHPTAVPGPVSSPTPGT